MEPLPELHAAALDPGTLAALFDDLERAAEAVEVRLKGAAAGHAAAGAVPLREAERLLVEGRVRGVQVRYRWAGAAWCDTLLRGADGVRLVRMEVDPAPTARGVPG